MNRYELAGRVAVVTGGARGIGHSVAERIVQSGASVSLWDVDAARLAEASSRLSNHGVITTVALDLTENTSVQAATEAGKIDSRLSIPPALLRWENTGFRCSI